MRLHQQQKADASRHRRSGGAFRGKVLPGLLGYPHFTGLLSGRTPEAQGVVNELLREGGVIVQVNVPRYGRERKEEVKVGTLRVGRTQSVAVKLACGRRGVVQERKGESRTREWSIPDRNRRCLG